MGYDDYNDYDGKWNSSRGRSSPYSGQGGNWGSSYEQRDDYAPQGEASKTQLFIRHLPPDMDENGVRNMFGKFGPIESVLFRGDGGALVFVRFQYPESAQDAISQMNNFTVPWPTGGPYTLLVEYAKPKLGRGGKGKGKGKGSFDNGDWESSTIPPSRAPRERSRSPYSGRWDDNIPGKGKGKGGGGGGPRGLREATCLVYNVPEGTTWEHLKNFFARAGYECPYTRVDTTKDGQPVGIASFDTIERMVDAMRALSNSTMFFANNSSATSTVIHMELDGLKRPTPEAFFRTIQDFVEKEDSPPIAESGLEGPCTVYCGGLANDVPVEELTSMFAPFGQILRLDVKPPFHEWKGSYAFILYDNPDSAIAAVKALNGMEMSGAPNGRIQVDIQQQRKHWPGYTGR
ncbi:RNA-binding protein, putative [Perkinsus marinus ATCC 50983]|uniref:RNA-binding protein, putative n=1 Tax=Perkinsus marinus (strain ATCC 50983 / TXsc) TaxID=423536 RepID=C5L6C8_PERM5|nr:RNA-binding protein, putative [Perkinsus marinus ATCC 50983]EER07755.1 RNA-binding protein, putative [Perkinsus marinus ATCC 50983]|eukprot:XP_002775939.1 RNA-binding protein, putative [Perkinsus marinus ATCC 50983]